MSFMTVRESSSGRVRARLLRAAVVASCVLLCLSCGAIYSDEDGEVRWVIGFNSIYVEPCYLYAGDRFVISWNVAGVSTSSYSISFYLSSSPVLSYNAILLYSGTCGAHTVTECGDSGEATVIVSSGYAPGSYYVIGSVCSDTYSGGWDCTEQTFDGLVTIY